jgi:hypothetical protein
MKPKMVYNLGPDLDLALPSADPAGIIRAASTIKLFTAVIYFVT